ncbi:TPA: hypothetical protein HA235_04310 [Candidatus Woesearchaeota archaeon]|nr:hypothetical protein [uncultured archaeon]MBS3173004.1 hypothetical protein [Candidatus Woesearchaeota archaeon]AQS32912.1 hypothetical protein [uncultured archaeon]AQS34607.1 hypothetical protein [uncultured archaeon]HIH31906.1 hypothetical protein [Candidatus Woesearchaeota archaeon]
MKKTKKNLLALAGVVSAVVGAVLVYPSFSKEIYWLATASILLLVLGLVLLAFAFGD